MSQINLDQYAERLKTAMFTTIRKLNAELADELGGQLTPTQFYLMKHMSCKQRSTVSEMAELMGVKPSAITGIVDRMHNHGLVNRDRDQEDRRVVWVSLTDKGKQVLMETERKRIDIVKKYISLMEPAKLEAMVESFEELSKLIQNDSEK
ncbi:MAG: MarR family transcriptional regulator [Bacillaceae bacterium]|nr:MarR family transcriptional regulator [Bacillaceae bacterium]